MKKEVGGNLLKFLFFIACGYGIVRISIWSYIQTQQFFIPFDTNGNSVISNGLALIFQYGQNVALFLAAIEAGRRIAYQNKISNSYGNQNHIVILEDEIRKSKTASNIYYILFSVFAIIDAGTNVGQFYSTTLADAKLTMSGSAYTIFMVVGTLVSLSVIFVEELFMDTANATLHAFNDVLESVGLYRISSLDLFIDPDKIIATRLEERGSGKNKGVEEKNKSHSDKRFPPIGNSYENNMKNVPQPSKNDLFDGYNPMKQHKTPISLREKLSSNQGRKN